MRGGSSVEKIQTIQLLWSGYGEIARYAFKNTNDTVIVKSVTPPQTPSHPRGWQSAVSHQRKLASYSNEQIFYRDFSQLTDATCRTPRYYSSGESGDSRWVVMEDLDAAGFDGRHQSADKQLASKGIHWLAGFHARYMRTPTKRLWPVGTYWHFATRQEEWRAMPDSKLKQHARAIDSVLNGARFQTLLHGDAKLANFCFVSKSPHHREEADIAAVDFQYVGSGCGVKDVMYFLGSCFDARQLYQHAPALIDEYFTALRSALTDSTLNTKPFSPHQMNALEAEWRRLYCFAVADFERFLAGWSPEHRKRNAYSAKLTDMACEIIKNGSPHCP
ncbi:phosphotransferase [Alteromonas sp. SM 2104]|nr:phosphotransferase [Alteromonas oceanisediminis]